MRKSAELTNRSKLQNSNKKVYSRASQSSTVGDLFKSNDTVKNEK